MTQQPFAAFDIDGTLFRDGLYREVALEIMRQGVVDQSLVDNVHQKLASWKSRSCRNAYDEYEIALVEALEESLPNLPTVVFDAAVEKIAREQLDHVYTYTREMLTRLKKQGYFLIAISGSHEELVRHFAKRYGFDAWIGQHYLRDENGFTGEVIETYTNKDILLQGIIKKFNLTMSESYAFGDSGGDRHMLAMVDHPVAFNPTADLLDVAMEQNWPIVIERKSIVFELRKGKDGYILAEAGKI